MTTTGVQRIKSKSLFSVLFEVRKTAVFQLRTLGINKHTMICQPQSELNWLRHVFCTKITRKVYAWNQWGKNLAMQQNKRRLLKWFTSLHVFQNQYDFLSSMKHKSMKGIMTHLCESLSFFDIWRGLGHPAEPSIYFCVSRTKENHADWKDWMMTQLSLLCELFLKLFKAVSFITFKTWLESFFHIFVPTNLWKHY